MVDGRIGIVVPMRWECRAMLQQLPGAKPCRMGRVTVWNCNSLWILNPGTGDVRAMRCTDVLDQLDINRAWLVGWCGGLVPEMKCGDLVLGAGSTVAGTAQPALSPDPLLESVAAQTALDLGVALHTGAIASVRRIVRGQETRTALARSSGSIAVEMEATGLTRWASGEDRKLSHLRVVLDPFDSDLPGGGPGFLLRLPGQYRAVRNVWTHARRANGTLAHFIRTLVATVGAGGSCSRTAGPDSASAASPAAVAED
jgi:nucleoside phosphorylase